MSRKGRDVFRRTRHSSLEIPDADGREKKKQDNMLSKAKNKLYNLSDALKPKFDGNGEMKKSLTQTTIEYFFKSCPNNNHHNNNNNNSKDNQNNHGFYCNEINANASGNNNNNNTIDNRNCRASSLQKQHSVGSYPIKVDACHNGSHCGNGDYSSDEKIVSRTDNFDDYKEQQRTTAALALERPRKKLSFREPEIMGYNVHTNRENVQKRRDNCRRTTNGVARNNIHDDDYLESQAMRVVRTVGQAFEVCHKLSINAPENEHKDEHDDETLTQDLISDRLSDITCDKPKKDLLSESDKLSLPDETAFKDMNCVENNIKNTRNMHLDVLPPPPSNNNTSSRSPLLSGETYASPQSDGLISLGSGGSGGGSATTLPAPGSALSAHHELQLLREQLEQQNQQTQAALAQLQLTREQLAAEQTARLEAQARTHQLLVHNRELLDHIAALVAHLQGGGGSDKSNPQTQNSPHVTMPQQQQQQQQQGFAADLYGDHVDMSTLDHNSVILQALGLNSQGLIENRAVTTCLPASSSSPIRTTFNPAGTIFNFPPYQPPLDAAASFESQLIQRLQSLTGYTPPHLQPYNNYNNQTIPSTYLQTNLYNPPLVNNNYTLQPPPQKKLPPSPLAVRHSYSGSPVLDKRVSPARTTELNNVGGSPTFQHNNRNSYQQQQQQVQNYQNYNQNRQNMNHLQVQPQQQQQNAANSRQPSPKPSPKSSTSSPLQQRQADGSSRHGKEPQFIKPLSQMGTLTTTDVDGRLRVIVPVPASADDAGSLFASLKLGEDVRPANVPSITRSTSEKVPNRSELMSQVQRTAWARHTTK